MFSSQSLAVHLARGLIGIGAFAASLSLAPSHPGLALAALPAAFVALRGCPTCWLVGLVQTLVSTARRRASAGPCSDGSCAGQPKAKLEHAVRGAVGGAAPLVDPR